MGSCVSVSSTRHRRRRSRKLSVAARKFRRKLSTAIAADAPIVRGAGSAASCLARHGVVHVEAPDSNVTLRLTKLQWQHSQMDAGSGRYQLHSNSIASPSSSSSSSWSWTLLWLVPVRQ